MLRQTQRTAKLTAIAVLLLNFRHVETLRQEQQLTSTTPRGSYAESALFEDDFESGLSKWQASDTASVRIVDSQTPAHRRVLELIANGALVHVLIRGSRPWSRVAVEGEMMFPDPGHSYLGFIWGYDRRNGRSSYANMYVKGNGSYLQVNPHWDANPIREMYPEYSADLAGDARIVIGKWHRFRVELIEGKVHFYVAPAASPQLTFDLFESEGAGEIGFRPRVVGERVWIDNIRVTAIDRFSAVVARPPREIARDRLLTEWDVFGPRRQTAANIEMGRDHLARSAAWKRFETDIRGAVIAARLLDYLGPRTVAYFRTTIRVDTAKTLTVRLASLNHAAVWWNGRFQGHVPPVETAWYDIAADSTRPHVDLRFPAIAGENVLVIRLRSGTYASGGFFAALLN